jgi:molybdenum cofactor cytidylyltransferase
MITAAVLAAGAGKRIGTPKALLRYKKHSFLETILINLYSAGITKIYVVVGMEFDKVQKSLSIQYPIDLIQNPHPEEGPLSSFKRALKKMPVETKGCIMVLVDHPLVMIQTYRHLKLLGEKNENSIYIPVYKNKNGHPVFFGKKFFAQLLRAPLSEGARYVVRQNPEAVQKFETSDEGVIADIDSQEDFDLFITNKIG